MTDVAIIDELNLDETPPIQGEVLYRRVLPGGWFKSGRPNNPLPQKTFAPRAFISEDRPGDFDGISVSLASLTTIEAAATRPDTGKKAHLAAVSVQHVHELGLTVQAKAEVLDPAHALIPELNSIDMQDPDKAIKIDEWALALRDRAAIVYEALKRDQ